MEKMTSQKHYLWQALGQQVSPLGIVNIRYAYFTRFFIQWCVIIRGHTNTWGTKVIFWISSVNIYKVTFVTSGGGFHKYPSVFCPFVNYTLESKSVRILCLQHILIHSYTSVYLSISPSFRVNINKGSSPSIIPYKKSSLENPFIPSSFICVSEIYYMCIKSFPGLSETH